MAKHNYRLEPNVSFTPDQKWVVFRSNMFGDTYTFAVEVSQSGMKTQPAESIQKKFAAALDDLVAQVKQGPLHPGRDPLRQPLARHGLGEVRYRSRAGHHRR